MASSAAGNGSKYVNEVGGVPIIGLPPTAYFTDSDPNDRARAASGYGVMDITPCLPKPGEQDKLGLTLYTMDPDEGGKLYKNIVKYLGYEVKTLPIKVAFLNDISISESWSNDYGESSFEGMLNSEQSKLNELRMITGKRTASEALGELSKKGYQQGGVAGSAMGLGSDIFSTVAGAAESTLNMLGGSSASKIALGSKVDFPTIWQGGGYMSSLSFTVRLYNPNPRSQEAYDEYILKPLAHLLPLVTPVADSPYTYSFPLLVKIDSPGLFCMDTGCVTSIDMIKGGDSNDITFGQQPGMVDLKITVNNLYNTMIIDPLKDGGEPEVETNNTSGRPTLKRYFDNMRAKTEYDDPYSGKKESGAPTPSEEQTPKTPGEPVPDAEIPTGEEALPRVGGDFGAEVPGLPPVLDGATPDMVNDVAGGVANAAQAATDIAGNTLDVVAGPVTSTLTSASGALTTVAGDAVGGLDTALGGVSKQLGGTLSSSAMQLPILGESISGNLDSVLGGALTGGGLGSAMNTLSGLGVPSGDLSRLYETLSISGVNPSTSDVVNAMNNLGITVPNMSVGSTNISIPTEATSMTMVAQSYASSAIGGASSAVSSVTGGAVSSGQASSLASQVLNNLFF